MARKYSAAEVADLMRLAARGGFGVGADGPSLQQQAPLMLMHQSTPAGVVPMSPMAHLAVPSAGLRPMMVPQLLMPGNSLTGRPPVSMKPPSEMREFSLGFDSVTNVAGHGGTAQVITPIQTPFRGKRLVIDSTIASSFLITSIFVGTAFQGAATENLPGSLFVPESLVPLQLDTAQIGNTITINVLNRSDDPLRFIAGMIGDVLR